MIRSARTWTSAAALFLATALPLNADTSSRFCAFTASSVIESSFEWSDPEKDKLKNFLDENQGAEAGELSYLVIPKWTVDSSERKVEGLAAWGVFEPLAPSQTTPPGNGAVRPVELPNDLFESVKRSYLKEKLHDVYGKDLVILDDQALKDLFRLRWLNQSSPFSSVKLDNLRRFTDEFLVDDHAWLMNPVGSGRMVFISDFRSEEETRVYVVIPRQGGSILSIPIFRTNRAVLRDAVQLLKEEMLPVTLTFEVEPVGFRPGLFNLPEISDELSVRLVGADGDFLSGFNENKTEGRKICFLGHFTREALDARHVQVGFPSGSDYRLLVQGDLVSRATIDLAEDTQQNPILRLSISQVPKVSQLITEDIWHHRVSFGELRFVRDPDSFKRLHDKLKLPAKPEDLFEDPQSYLHEIGSRSGRRLLGLHPKDQRTFVSELAELNRALCSLWSYVQIAHSIAGKELDVVIVKHVPAPTRSWRRMTSPDRMSSYIRLFLNHLNSGEHEGGIVIKEVEMPAHEDHITHSVDILLVPAEPGPDERRTSPTPAIASAPAESSPPPPRPPCCPDRSPERSPP
jgi:hypothetical protein